MSVRQLDWCFGLTYVHPSERMKGGEGGEPTPPPSGEGNEGSEPERGDGQMSLADPDDLLEESQLWEQRLDEAESEAERISADHDERVAAEHALWQRNQTNGTRYPHPRKRGGADRRLRERPIRR